MSDRPTPETDAAKYAAEKWTNAEWEPVECVDYDFARRLEKERDEAREGAKAADEHRRLAEKLAEKAIFERDQLRLRIAELQNGIFVEPLK